jgi:AraC-like DNA-binding protein
MKPKYEKIFALPDHSFHYAAYDTPAFEVPLHIHPEIEVTQIIRGEGYRLVGDCREEFSGGDLVIIGANLPHAYYSYHRRPENSVSCAARVLQFSGERLTAACEAFPEYQRLGDFLTTSTVTGLRFTGETQEQITHLFDQLAQQAFAEQASFDALLTFLRLLYHMAQAPTTDRYRLSSAAFTYSISGEGFTRIHRVCDFINQHYPQELSQVALAEQAGLTPAAFSRVFHRATGRSFRRYVNEVRIAQACRRLIETDHAIIQIAFDCGYCNLANFNRRFRELKALSPRAFRAQFRSPTGKKSGASC